MGEVRSLGGLLRRRAPVPVRHLPCAVFTPVDLRRAQGVNACHAVNGRGSVLEADGVGGVPEHLGFEELILVGRAVREAVREMGEQLVELLLPTAFFQAPSTVTGSFRDQMARRGPASPL